VCVLSKEKVQICPIFKSDWIHHLRKRQDGFVKSVNNKYIQVQLFLSGSDSYLTNGVWLARSFGFKKPTTVKLYFEGLDNHFDMFVVRREDQGVICISSDDSDVVSVSSDGVDSELVDDESDDDESTGNEGGNNDSDVDSDESGFENVSPLSWKLNVTSVVASVKKMQVGVCICYSYFYFFFVSHIYEYTNFMSIHLLAYSKENCQWYAASQGYDTYANSIHKKFDQMRDQDRQEEQEIDQKREILYRWMVSLCSQLSTKCR
jgi:hypothetical protein